MRLHLRRSGRDRLDHPRRALMEIADEALEALLAAQLRRLLGLLRRHQLFGLAPRQLEDMERAGEAAHLMRLAEERHIDIEIAVGKEAHPLGDDSERPADAARDAEDEHARRQHDEATNDDVDKRRLPI